MKNFAIELATDILNIELQKERLVKDEKLNNRLCVCRKKILERFIKIAQLFYVRFTSKVVKFLEDYNIEKSLKIEDLGEWYQNEMYSKINERGCIKSKMILLYKLLQDKSDNLFFQHFEKKYKLLIYNSEYNNTENFNKLVTSFYDDMSDWIDYHILNLLALKVDCNNIDDAILTEFPINSKISKSPFNDSNCIYKEYCEHCNLHDDSCPSLDLVQTEDIHLYITEELIQSKSLEDYFDILYKFHKKLDSVELILDFKLVNQKNVCLYCSDNLKNMFLFFKSVKVINCENINFENNSNILTMLKD